MKNSYHGQICIEPNMPDFQYPFKFIKLTVDFEIICPNCGPDKGKIKKNGHDKKMKDHPQNFYCRECGCSFFAHTSWIFTRFTDEIVLKVLEDLFIDHLSPKSIAKSLNVSPSFITRIRYNLFDVLKKKIDIIQSEANYLKNFENLPLIRQSGIWWDETYFKINGTYYCLILIINALGQVIGYKFSKSRKLEDYMEILNPIKGVLPEKPIFICDGNPTYESVVKKVNVEAFLIQHIHSHPWKDAILHHFIPSNTNDFIEQITIKLPYDSFLSDERVAGYAMKKIIVNKESSPILRKRGRPKGKKDTEKRAKWGSKLHKKKKRSTGKRGRKNLENDGFKISFEPDPLPGGWKILQQSSSSKHSTLIEPSISELTILLSVTYEIMNGGAIQSNLIESKNSVIKDNLPNHGLKGVHQYDYLVGTYLFAREELKCDIFSQSIIKYEPRSSLGFYHMFDFFIPDPTQIEIY